MLAAFWALVHPPWSSGSRVYLKWDVFSRAISQCNHRTTSEILGIGLSYRTSLHSTPPINVARDSPNTKDPCVFEEHSDEYKSLEYKFPLPPTPILTLIERRLPEFLSKPTPDDKLIFEDASNSDYEEFIPTAITENPSTLSQTLSRLVSAERYDEAYHVLLEVRDSDLPIPCSHIYEMAAQAAILSSSSHTLEPSERTSRFLSWFSLVPPAHQADKVRKFLRTRHLIFQSPSMDISLAAKFAVLLSSKGYAALISAEAVPLIIRFATPDFSLQFIADFEEANRTYWSSFRPESLALAGTQMVTVVRGAAIKSFANSGHLKHALALLPNPPEETFRLSTRTYDTLLTRLHTAKSSPAYKHIPLIENLRNNETTSLPSKQEGFCGYRNVHHMTALFAELEPSSAKYIGPSMAKDLKYLIGTVQSRDNLPSLTTLLRFFDGYISTGRTEAVATLRRFALNAHPTCASHFLLAEITYYRLQRLDNLVIQIFVDHFFISGVPWDDVVIRYQQIENDRSGGEALNHPALGVSLAYNTVLQPAHDSKTPLDQKYHRLNRVTNLRRGKYNDRYRMKLWPSRSHTDIIWGSLVALAPTEIAVERLYDKLIKLASSHETELRPQIMGDICPPAPWRPRVGTRAFTPFIQRLLPTSDPNRGHKILSDMMKVGIIPSIHNFTQVAGHYARIGDAQKAFLVLDSLEAQHPHEESGTTIEKKQQDPHEWLPRPDVPFYTSLIRGFTISRRVPDALEAERRLRRRFNVVSGQYPALDAAYTHLSYLQQEIEGQTIPWC